MNMTDTNAIIERYKKNVPVQVIALAKELGVDVYGVDWNDSTSGMIKRKDDGSYAIYVNSKHRPWRQRFTVAHELAHYILHKDHIGDGISDDALYRSGLQNWIETEANKFAVDLLMPQEEVERKKRDPSCIDVKSMAEYFQVSKQAMAIRLGVPN